MTISQTNMTLNDMPWVLPKNEKQQ